MVAFSKMFYAKPKLSKKAAALLTMLASAQAGTPITDTASLKTATTAWCNGDTTTYGDISEWDTAAVTDLSSLMLSHCSNYWLFNAPIGSWDVSSVTTMQGTFQYAYVFNQPLDSWDVSSVTNMNYMFSFSYAFDQALCWDTEGMTTTNMFAGSPGSANSGAVCPTASTETTGAIPTASTENTGAICFSGDSLLTLEDGSGKAFRDLAVGDVILSADRNGKVAPSPVVFLPHNKNNITRQFDLIETASGKSLTMTRNHLLPLCDGTLVTARSLEIGQCVRTVNGEGSVSKVTRDVTAGGVYTAVTADEFLVVNGIVASPFALASGVTHSFFDTKDVAAWCADNEALLAEATADVVKEAMSRRRLTEGGVEGCVTLLNSMYENYKDEGVGWGTAGFGFRNFNNLRGNQKEAAESLMQLAGWN